jgi:uncharacterized DUF497 family protein
MHDEEFEWDDLKAKANIAKHGITFEAAQRVFDDAFALYRLDARPKGSEARRIIIGYVGERCLTVAYVERGERVRIISARKSDKHEQREYYNSQTAE